MPGSDLDLMDQGELKNLAGALLWQLRLADAFWFINTEKRFGLSMAEEVNADVWEKTGRLAARDITTRFGIQNRGLDGFLRAFKYFSWSLMLDYELEQSPGEIILGVPSCPAQEGRKKHGLGEYSCKDMHYREFAAFAAEIDPGIRVHCLFAPPDDHPENMYCRWRFVMG